MSGRRIILLGDLFLKFINSHSVDYAYDEDGNGVICDYCGQPIVCKDGAYYCPECQ